MPDMILPIYASWAPRTAACTEAASDLYAPSWKVLCV
jgi:ABC-type spermidine/putrescine transport system permease subunit I